MNKKIFKNSIFVITFCIIMWIFSKSVDAAYVSIKPSTDNANPGQSVSLTISSDCTGRVNLSASNGTLSTSSEWVENGGSATVTVGSSGTTTITATPTTMADASGNDVQQIAASSTSIKINTATNNNENNSNTGSNNSGGTGNTGNSGSSNNSGNSGNTGTTNNSGNTETNNSTKKSNNANLRNLGIKPNDFSGFKPGTISYNVTVPSDVESVEVYAYPADSKNAKVSGTGVKTLQEGTNELSVVVTAEDGTTKTYTINVTRESVTKSENEEKTTNESVSQTEVKDGLSELKIGDLELTPSFDANIYEYKVEYIGEDTTLNIEATPTDERYIVDISGNEGLEEGENTITILVSDKDGNNIATYQVTVEKSLVDFKALAREKEEKEQKYRQQKNIIVGVVIGVIVIGIIIFVIVKRRRNANFAEDYSEVPFAGLNDDDEFEDSYEEDIQDFEDEAEQVEESEYEEEKKEKKRHKGKRFK